MLKTLLSYYKSKKKYFLSYCDFGLQHLVAGYNITNREKDHYSLKKAVIKNKLLAKELEEACRKSQGILTYEQYQTIDQFGRHGYHATHILHGFQAVTKEKALDIVNFCIKNDIHHVIDIGCGNGILGMALVYEAKAQAYPLVWSGIEINKSVHEEIKKNFKRKGLQQYIQDISVQPQKSHCKEKSLLLFSYCLDSVPPELFINSSTEVSFPNSIIGIQVNANELSEVILTKQLLRQKKLSLEDGIFTNEQGTTFDLRSWRLLPYQRAYISIAAIQLLATCVAIYNPSRAILIDEFRTPPKAYSPEPLGIACDLEKHMLSRPALNITSCYKHAGETLYYYPLYLNTMQSLLQSFGFTAIHLAVDEQLKKLTTGETPDPGKKIASLCGMIMVTQRKKRQNTIIFIEPPKFSHFYKELKNEKIAEPIRPIRK